MMARTGIRVVMAVMMGLTMQISKAISHMLPIPMSPEDYRISRSMLAMAIARTITRLVVEGVAPVAGIPDPKAGTAIPRPRHFR